MKALICFVLLALPACGTGLATEEFVRDQVASLIGRVETRVAAGEDFDAVQADELAKLRESLISAKAKEMLSDAIESKAGGVLGINLGDGKASESEGGLGLLALWLLRNFTRKKLGLPATAIMGTADPNAEEE